MLSLYWTIVFKDTLIKMCVRLRKKNGVFICYILRLNIKVDFCFSLRLFLEIYLINFSFKMSRKPQRTLSVIAERRLQQFLDGDCAFVCITSFEQFFRFAHFYQFS